LQLKFSTYFLHPHMSYISKPSCHNCFNHPNDTGTLSLLWIFYNFLLFFISFLEYWFNGYIPRWRYLSTLALDDAQKEYKLAWTPGNSSTVDEDPNALSMMSGQSVTYKLALQDVVWKSHFISSCEHIHFLQWFVPLNNRSDCPKDHILQYRQN
jgi:hypothetical protein